MIDAELAGALLDPGRGRERPGRSGAALRGFQRFLGLLEIGLLADGPRRREKAKQLLQPHPVLGFLVLPLAPDVTRVAARALPFFNTSAAVFVIPISVILMPLAWPRIDSRHHGPCALVKQ